MNDLEKLRVMLPHWIDHNQGHGKEFARWAEKLTGDSPEVAQLLHSAVRSLQEVQNSLEEALEKAGGFLAAPGGHDTHGHEHSHEHGHAHGSDAGHHHHCS